MKWKITPKKFFNLLKDAFKSFSKDDTWTMGAALSYYTVFSLAPILIIVIAAAGMIFGKEAVQGQIFGEVKGFLGAEGAAQVQEMVKSAYKPGKSQLATGIAIALLIYGATTVFGQLQASLNKIWQVKPKPKKGYIKYIRDRFLSFSLIIALGFLLLVSLVVSAAMVALGKFLASKLPEVSVYLLQILTFVLSLLVNTLLFAMMYKFLPDAKVKWRDVWAGSIFTALLFALGRFLIALYLGKSDIGSTYGAAGSIVLVLLWVNYSSQILFFGAEFTQVYATQYGSHIRPSEYAVRVKNIELEQSDTEGTRTFEEKVKHVEEYCALDDDEAKESPVYKKAEENKQKAEEASESAAEKEKADSKKDKA
ncbi:MAG: YihY/virulence factor BrkB family protein [Sphingobacteriales bacterium]|nr:MAG: YihY/virulence factor BrkB family protein [Sphingobacteriales bacterium]